MNLAQVVDSFLASEFAGRHHRPPAHARAGRPSTRPSRRAPIPGWSPCCATGGSRPYTPTRPRPMAHVQAGRHVVVVTPTASGKTLCYNVPVLDAILKEPETRALYLFPTKALSQDQLRELHGLVERAGAWTSRPTPTTATPRPPPGAWSASRPHRRHQPGHAPHRHPAPPHQVGEALREPALSS